MQAHNKRPVLFLHIPKTGGASLAAALKVFFQPEDILTESGNISVDYLRANEHRLQDKVFIYGHPGHDVVGFMAGRALEITVLRRPEDHLISNYLHILRDSGNHLHVAAQELGFAGFISTFWQISIFQTMSLDVTITPSSNLLPQEIERRIGKIFELIDSLHYVGCLEFADEMCFQLSIELGLPSQLMMPRFNTGAEYHKPELFEQLRDEYSRVRRDPRIAHLIAIEEAVYLKAASLRGRYQRRLIETAFARVPATWDTSSPFLAYSGENGAVLLASNWKPPEPTTVGPVWWTDSGEISTLIVELRSSAARFLTMQVHVIHFTIDFMFEVDGLRLDHRIENNSGTNGGRIIVDLSPVFGTERRRTLLTLRQPIQVAPALPPFFPAMALCDFKLT